MKKNRKKIYYFLSFMFILNFNIINYDVLGNINSNENVVSSNDRYILSVDEATQRAIANSSNIESKKESLYLSKESEEKLLDIISNSNDSISVINASAQLMSSQMQKAITLKSIDAIKDNIEYSIISYFASIIKAEKSLEMYDEELSIDKKELDILKIKVDLGIESESNYELKKHDYEMKKNKRTLFLSAIDAAYRSLNFIIGEDLDSKYKLDLKLKFEKLDDIDIGSYTSDYIDEDLRIKSANNSMNVARYKLETYIDSIYDFVTGSSFKNPVSRDEIIAELKSAGRNVEDLKEEIKNKISSKYSKIKDKEMEIDVAKLDLKEKYNKLNILEKKLQVGEILKLEVDKFKLYLKQAENELYNSEIEYMLMVMEFKNSNILLSNL